jgi:hypothetical protein
MKAPLIFTALLLLALSFSASPAQAIGYIHRAPTDSAACTSLKEAARDGDLIFVEIDHMPFTEVAESTMSWTAHVGIAFKDPEGWMVYESTFPRSKKTEMCKFLSRSKNERFALTRYSRGLGADQVARLKQKAASLFGYFYHTGFDFDNNGKEFCSKYVYDSYAAIGIQVGEIITFQQMLDAFPKGPQRDALVGFWDRWFMAALRLSGTPWQRRTVTPASQLNDRGFALIMGRREI